MSRPIFVTINPYWPPAYTPTIVTRLDREIYRSSAGYQKSEVAANLEFQCRGRDSRRSRRLQACGVRARATDSGGKPHEFHFRMFMFETGVALDAFELREGNPAGYQFQVNAEPEEDQLALLGRLIEKLRRALAVKHIADSEHGLQITKPLVVRGLIDWDSEQGGSTPLLVIDGREISWDEFGRMISGFEGFQFKLEIRDKSEEI